MTITTDNVIELINGLNNATLNKHYEQKLEVITDEIGFGVALAQLASDKKFDMIHRQFSGILLKKYIKQHWGEEIGGNNEDDDDDDDDDDFINEDILNEDEKQQLKQHQQQRQPIKKYRTATVEEKKEIKKLLSPCLSDPSSKIRTAIAMCIANIGIFEWPHDWPELVDELLACLKNTNTNNSGGENHLLHGVIRCLEILCDPSDGKLADEQIEALIKQVYPVLTELLGKDVDPMIHIRIINVFRSTVTHITYMKGIAKDITKALFPFISSWMPIFIGHLSRVLDLNSPHINHYFTIMAAIIEIFTMLIQDFPKKTAQYVQDMLSPIWILFNSCYPIYEKCEINPVHGIVSNFVEEGVTKIDRLSSSIFDFMQQIVDNPKFSPYFKPFLKPIFTNSIYFMQMPYDLTDLWDSDPNLFLESEDDNTYTPRVVSTTLVQTMCEVYKKDGADQLFQVISECLIKAEEEKNKNNKFWWKIREAALVALCDSHTILRKNKEFKADSFLSTNLIKDFQGNNNTTDNDDLGILILRGRSLICASKFSNIVDPSISLPFFKQAVILITQDVPLTLKLSSVISIGSFAPRIAKESILEYIPSTIQALVGMINQLTEDSLLLVLECIKMLAKIDKDVTGQLEPLLTPHLTQAWVNYSNDPSLCDALKEIFQCICACPKSYPGVLQRMIPTLNIILCAYDNPMYYSISDSAIDVLGLLVARVDQQIDAFVLDQLFAPLLNILLASNLEKYRTIIKASLCSLLPIISKTPSELLSKWTFKPANSGDSINGIHSLFLVLKRILFETDELVRTEVPQLINAILIKHSEVIGSQITPLFETILQAFYNCKLPTTKTKFSSVFTRLIVQHKSTIIDYLASIPGPKGNGNALVFVLNEWQKYHFEFTSKLDNNVSVVAMCVLANLGDKRLESIMVDGQQILPDSLSTRDVRRKKSQYIGTTGDKWTSVPLFHKIFSNLLDVIKLEKEELNKNNSQTPNSKHQDFDSDEEYYDENVEQSDDDDEIDGKKYPNVDEHGFAPAEDYEDMLEYANADDDDDVANYLSDEFNEDVFDILSKSDPLYHIDILKYLSDFFSQLSVTNPSVYNQVAPILNEFKVAGMGK